MRKASDWGWFLFMIHGMLSRAFDSGALFGSFAVPFSGLAWDVFFFAPTVYVSERGMGIDVLLFFFGSMDAPPFFHSLQIISYMFNYRL